MTSEFVRLLHDVGTEQACVSIYGATAATYERMTAVVGSYAAFRRGLALLASSAVPIVVRMPVTSLNYEEIHLCRSIAEELKCKFQYTFDLTPTVTGDLTPLQYRLSAETKIRLDRDMLPQWGSAPVEESCLATDEFIECACGHTRFAITPYGEMNLCTAFPIPRYDLRTGTVGDGWDVLKRTVDEAHPNHRHECPTCDVKSYCRQGRNDAWLETGDMSVCLPHYQEWAKLEQRTHALLNPRRPA
ncbi:MAG: hypothetical protein HC938_07890 [Nitrospira sp.]|nr:hypothetical protein [Nitrospira sp.]